MIDTQDSRKGTGAGQDTTQLLHFDRKIALGFGTLVLLVMIIVCLAGAETFRRVAQSNENQLTTVLTGVLADTINRASFSGRYHTRLLLEEITAKQPQLTYVYVADTDNTIIAHSDPTQNNARLPERLVPVVRTVREKDIPAISRRNTAEGAVQEIVMPYRSGFENQLAGIIVVGLSLKDVNTQLATAWIFLACLIGLLTLFSLGATYLMSKYLATPVRQLALKLQGILHYAPMYIAIHGQNGTLEECSASSLRLLQGDKHWPFLIDGKTLSPHNSDAHVSELPFEIDGRDRIASVTVFPIARTDRNETRIVCSIATDITDQRNAERALREHLDQLEELVSQRTRDLEGAYSAIREHEMEVLSLSQLRESLLEPIPFDGKYRHIAKAAQQLLGAARSGIWLLEGQSSSTTLHLQACTDAGGTDRGAPPDSLAVGHGGVGSIVAKDGHGIVGAVLNSDTAASWERPFGHVSGYRLTNSDGETAGILAVYTDEALTPHQESILEDLGNTASYVVRAQHAFETLAAANRTLIARERLATLGQLTATVSHELRNPLGTVAASFYTIQRNLKGEQDAKVKRALERSARSIERCDRIIEELLCFTRDTELHLTNSRMDSWLREELDSYSFPESLQLRVNIEEGLVVSFDQQAIYQCLVNILNNACDALLDMPEDQRRLCVSLTSDSREVRLAVEDSGPGISTEKLARVFEPLYSTKGFGTGLGLAVVQKLIILHGGRIDIDSAEGRGTQTTLILPRHGEIGPDSSE